MTASSLARCQIAPACFLSVNVEFEVKQCQIVGAMAAIRFETRITISIMRDMCIELLHRIGGNKLQSIYTTISFPLHVLGNKFQLL